MRKPSPPLAAYARFGVVTCLTAMALLALGVEPAFANHLEVSPHAPLWMRLGADAVLYLHIGGGTLGLATGALALLARKGGKLHRRAGTVFFASMLVMAGIGGVVAPFLQDRLSTLAGFMTFYLVATGWRTAMRRGGVDWADVTGLGVASLGAVVAAVLATLAYNSPEGTLDNSPPQGFYIFLAVSIIAVLGDLKLVLNRGIEGAQRIARHVWRMCFGLFVASGSLFLGQQQVFPDWLRATPILYIAALAPLPFLLFWMLRVRLSKKYRAAPKAATALS